MREGCCPCLLGVSEEAVHKNDMCGDLSLRWCIELAESITVHHDVSASNTMASETFYHFLASSHNQIRCM